MRNAGLGRRRDEVATITVVVGDPPCGREELLRASIQEGLKVKACRVCSTERGLSPEELIEGVEMASMVDLVDWVVSSDRTVSF